MDTNTEAPATFHQYGSTKRFFIHTLDHLTKSNIITPYTRDKLTDMINSEAKKDFAKVRKHVLDIMALHDTFDEVVSTFEPSNPSNSGGDDKKQKRRK